MYRIFRWKSTFWENREENVVELCSRAHDKYFAQSRRVHSENGRTNERTQAYTAGFNEGVRQAFRKIYGDQDVDDGIHDMQLDDKGEYEKIAESIIEFLHTVAEESSLNSLEFLITTIFNMMSIFGKSIMFWEKTRFMTSLGRETGMLSYEATIRMTLAVDKCC